MTGKRRRPRIRGSILERSVKVVKEFKQLLFFIVIWGGEV